MDEETVKFKEFKFKAEEQYSNDSLFLYWPFLSNDLGLLGHITSQVLVSFLPDLRTRLPSVSGAKLQADRPAQGIVAARR